MAQLDSEIADIDDISCKLIHSLCKIKMTSNHMALPISIVLLLSNG